MRRALKILSVGIAIELLARRERALSRAGFNVTSANPVFASDLLEADGPFAAVVIGHRVPESVRNQIAILAKAEGSKVVMLYLGSINRAELGDAHLGPFDNESLISALSELGLERRLA